MNESIHRILDANFNRAREALRVLEEHARLVLEDDALTRRAKELRHELSTAIGRFGLTRLVAARDIQGDVGTGITTEAESRRNDPSAVAIAAAKRAAEALRCLEEYGKITDSNAAAQIEQIRYRLYALEQDVLIGGPRRARLRAAHLHVLVTASLCHVADSGLGASGLATRPDLQTLGSGFHGDWLHVAEQAVLGGAEVIQLREKDLPDRELFERARRLREMTARHDVLLIINDRPDIACLVDADGVHLGQDDLPTAEARRAVGANRLIGKSTHSEEEARAALAEGADYIGVGPMFASPTKPNVPVQGPKLLIQIAAFASVPLVAIGGINSQNARELRPARATDDAATSSIEPPAVQVAVCNAVLSAPDPCRAVRELIHSFLGTN